MIEEFSFNEIKQKFHHVELKDQLEIEPRFSSGISILWDFQDMMWSSKKIPPSLMVRIEY